MLKRQRVIWAALCLALLCSCGQSSATPLTSPSVTITAAVDSSVEWTPPALMLPPVIATPEPITLSAEPVERQPDVLFFSHDYAAAAGSFDTGRALDFVRDLTGPEYAGRQGGSETGRQAAEYIADRFADFGLQPAGQDGFFQPVPLPYAQLATVPVLAIEASKGSMDLVFGRDFRPWWGGYAGSGIAEGQLFWLADGGAEQYVKHDVSGQVGLVRAQPTDEVVRLAMEHGLSGLLIIAEDENQVRIRRTYRESPYLADTLPVAMVTVDAASELLQGSAYTVSDLSILFDSVPLPTRVHLEITLDERGTVWGQNVLGMLPGKDPSLADEVLILGGHYDHVGLDPNGDLYAGANDDASGVAVLLEIARMWQDLGYAPDRTVLFAAWDGEEQGLLGSIYYVEHPALPLEQTVSMVQLDMVGLASEGVLTIDGLEPSNLLNQQLQASCELFGVATAPTIFADGAIMHPF